MTNKENKKEKQNLLKFCVHTKVERKTFAQIETLQNTCENIPVLWPCDQCSLSSMWGISWIPANLGHFPFDQKF